MGYRIIRRGPAPTAPAAPAGREPNAWAADARAPGQSPQTRAVHSRVSVQSRRTRASDSKVSCQTLDSADQSPWTSSTDSGAEMGRATVVGPADFEDSDSDPDERGQPGRGGKATPEEPGFYESWHASDVLHSDRRAPPRQMVLGEVEENVTLDAYTSSEDDTAAAPAAAPAGRRRWGDPPHSSSRPRHVPTIETHLEEDDRTESDEEGEGSGGYAGYARRGVSSPPVPHSRQQTQHRSGETLQQTKNHFESRARDRSRDRRERMEQRAAQGFLDFN